MADHPEPRERSGIDLAPTVAGPVALFAAGLLFWYLVCQSAGVAEPWDATDYWTSWYPLSLVISGAAGLLFRRAGWRAGAALAGAQLPILFVANGIVATSIVGVAFVCALAIPAAAISTLTSFTARAFRRRRGSRADDGIV